VGYGFGDSLLVRIFLWPFVVLCLDLCWTYDVVFGFVLAFFMVLCSDLCWLFMVLSSDLCWLL